MKSFLQGRPNPGTCQLRPLGGQASEAVAKAKGTGADSAAGKSPSIECVKQGEKVVRMIVTCSCGERIEIDCLYPGG